MFFPTSIHPRSSPSLYPPSFMFSLLDKQTKDTKAKKKKSRNIPNNPPTPLKEMETKLTSKRLIKQRL